MSTCEHIHSWSQQRGDIAFFVAAALFALQAACSESRVSSSSGRDTTPSSTLASPDTHVFPTPDSNTQDKSIPLNTRGPSHTENETSQKAPSEQARDSRSQSTSSPPVPIYVRVVKNTFPPHWHEPPRNLRASGLDARYADGAIRVISEAMSLYPTPLLSTHLVAVHVLGALEIGGVPYGGTWYPTRAYLVHGAPEDGFTDERLEHAFHHELSSVLLNDYRSLFPEEEWHGATDSSFTYLGSGVNAVRENKVSSAWDFALLEQGILHEYAGSCLENDFNEIAAELFLSSPARQGASDLSPVSPLSCF